MLIGWARTPTIQVDFLESLRFDNGGSISHFRWVRPANLKDYLICNFVHEVSMLAEKHCVHIYHLCVEPRVFCHLATEEMEVGVSHVNHRRN